MMTVALAWGAALAWALARPGSRLERDAGIAVLAFTIAAGVEALM